MSWNIEPSFGVLGFVTEDHKIGLTQEQPGTTQTVFFSRSEVPELIEVLKRVLKEAEELYQQELVDE